MNVWVLVFLTMLPAWRDKCVETSKSFRGFFFPQNVNVKFLVCNKPSWFEDSLWVEFRVIFWEYVKISFYRLPANCEFQSWLVFSLTWLFIETLIIDSDFFFFFFLCIICQIVGNQEYEDKRRKGSLLSPLDQI